MSVEDMAETAIEIQSRILEEKVAEGSVEVVGETEDGKTLFQENVTEYTGA